MYICKNFIRQFTRGIILSWGIVFARNLKHIFFQNPTNLFTNNIYISFRVRTCVNQLHYFLIYCTLKQRVFTNKNYIEFFSNITKPFILNPSPKKIIKCSHIAAIKNAWYKGTTAIRRKAEQWNCTFFPGSNV